MATPIKTNLYKFPAGYRNPFNGSTSTSSLAKSPYSSYGPAAVTLGRSITFSVTGSPGAPADHALVAITSPAGQVFIFEFLYPASVAAAGHIGIPLATGAASTAAQVATAFLAILAAASVTPVGGLPEVLPWNMTQTGAAQLRINFNQAGSDQDVEGPEGIAIDSQTGPVVTFNPVVPARFGKNYAFLTAATS